MSNPTPDPPLRSLSSDGPEPDSATLPYDPDEWERRLAAARAQRERVLAERAKGGPPAADRRTVADYGRGRAGTHGAGPSASGLRPNKARPAAPPGDGTDDPPQTAQGSRPQRRVAAVRLRAGLVGVVVGAVGGTSLASLGAVGEGVGGLRARLAAFAPISGSDGASDRPPSIEFAAPVASTAPSLGPAPTGFGGGLAFAAPERADVTPAPALPELPPPAVPAVAPPPAALRPPAPPPAVPMAPVREEAPPPRPPAEIAIAAAETADVETAPLPVLPAPAVAAIEAGSFVPPRLRTSRIIVHTPEGMAADRRDMAETRLAEADWPAEATVASPYTIGETHVRYYHGRDRAEAEELAGLFEASARDFTDYTPSPEPGLLELWLDGEGAPRVARSQPVRTRTAPAPARTHQAWQPNLIERIANAFASGTDGNVAVTRDGGYQGGPAASGSGGRGGGTSGGTVSGGSRGGDGASAGGGSGAGASGGASQGGGQSGSSEGGGQSGGSQNGGGQSGGNSDGNGNGNGHGGGQGNGGGGGNGGGNGKGNSGGNGIGGGNGNGNGGDQGNGGGGGNGKGNGGGNGGGRGR